MAAVEAASVGRYLVKPSTTICEEVKARHARLLAADGTLTLGAEPLSTHDIFIRRLCDADQRERMLGDCDHALLGAP